jgi:antitoxin ParD1/3/4
MKNLQNCYARARYYQFLVYLQEIYAMSKNTSISLGNHFEQFIESAVSKGRYNTASEVVRAGLRLLEEEENRLNALRLAIQEGLDSGRVIDFDSRKNLEMLKASRKQNG